MRQDIEEAYTRVMKKHWGPSKAEGKCLRELTKHTATMYCRAMAKSWSGHTFDPRLFSFVEGFSGGSWNTRRTWGDTIALTNWYDLNHEFSHWWFYLHGPQARSGRGRHHHCDRHLEWEYTGADWICRRMLQDKPLEV